MDDVHPSSAPLDSDLATRVHALEHQMQALSHSIGHDLRAPLRIAAGYLDIFNEDHCAGLDATARHTLEVVRQQIAAADAMLLALLALAEVGTVELQHEAIDMTLLAEEAAALATDGTATLIDIEALPNVSGDRTLLLQAWRHLVDCALRFPPQADAPALRIGSRSTLDEHWYCIRGGGLDTVDAADPFPPPVRPHDAPDIGSEGIGPAIARRIVERHGGRVCTEYEAGIGRAYYFALPKPMMVAP